MNERDDFFYQAVLYAKEKNYPAARAMLRNLLFQDPDDIEGLLLYSIVAPNKEISIKALKRVLQINPEHEIAFNKLAKLKYAPPASIPEPTSPLSTIFPPPISNSVLPPTPNPLPQQPKAPQEAPPRQKLEPATPTISREEPARKRKKRKLTLDIVLIGLLSVICLCVSSLAMQKIFTTFLAGS